MFIRSLKFAATIVASLLLPATAGAQTFPSVPSGHVIGRTAIGTGPSQAIPFSQLLSSMLTSPLTVSQVNVNSILFTGSTSGTATLSAQAVAGTPSLKLPTTSGTLASNATAPIVLNSTTGNISCPTCVTTQTVFPSRAAAAALDLSAFSVIRTLSYSTAGDGGEATFQKIAGNFIDTRILTGGPTANGTSGCTNGTYYGVKLDGGTGRGADAKITVSGGVIMGIDNVGGYNGATAVGYSAGDVLSIGSDIPGCSGAKTFTVSTVSTPTGSFTDAAGNKWQILYPAAGLDARAMGVKFDWDGTDGTATDNFTTLQNAFSFAGYLTSTIADLGGSEGGQVLLAKQTAMVGCSGTTPLVVPKGVKVKGQGNYSSVLKICDTFSASSNIIEICNSLRHLACFGALLEDFQIFVSASVSGTSSRSVVYTNNAQHESGMRRMVIYPGGCGRGATYETGYGGATYILMDSVEYKGGKTHANCGGANGPQVLINYGTTQVIINNLNVSGYSSGSGGPRQDGLVITGGFVDIVGIHSEQVVNPVTVNIAGGLANGQVRARSVIGGVDCVGMFTLPSTNTQGNFMLSPPNALNGCTRLVANGQSGGSNLTGPVVSDTIFNP